MEDLVDLDIAVAEIERRKPTWLQQGFLVEPVTWRDEAEGWPPPFKTIRSEVKDADSIGVTIRKGEQEGHVVLFKGGWCDEEYWSGRVEDDVITEMPGYPDEMTVEQFGALLDRFVARFQ